MEIKKYVDIENLRESDVDLGGGMVRKRNDLAFQPGDLISITEKVDGSNASIRYDTETGKLECFSRRLKLSFDSTLQGFFNFVQTLNAADYADTPNYSIFGEWLVKHKIVYNPDTYQKWYVYSIYDNDKGEWLEQDAVKDFAKKHGLTYVNELYYGPFISWDHCRTFAHSPNYGDTQEGIVIRNITKLSDKTNRYPHIIKIVNKEFAESKRTHIKVVDPEKEAARLNAQGLMSSIVTRNRVEKILFKMKEDNLIPNELTPADMKQVAKNLPKLVYEDCMKEEKEIMVACGEYTGKMCSSIAMNIARDIILGTNN
jgi:hypothetical protein